MIGDKASDVRAGERAGVPSILVATGYGAAERHLVDPETPYAEDLLDVCRHREPGGAVQVNAGVGRSST